MNGKQIERSKKAKLLGLYVEENLRNRKTVNHIVKKLAPLAHAFKYATRLLPTETMRRLYDTHVQSHLISLPLPRA